MGRVDNLVRKVERDATILNSFKVLAPKVFWCHTACLPDTFYKDDPATAFTQYCIAEDLRRAIPICSKIATPPGGFMRLRTREAIASLSAATVILVATCGTHAVSAAPR